MLETKHMTSPTSYASGGDFCRIFAEQTDELYQLSFLLTADHEKAEQCFVSGWENSAKGNRVFKEWARSWARRVVIQCAIRVINPSPMEEGASSSSSGSGNTLPVEHREIAAILALRPFDRFVYVMSVLERYSDQDCSVLLDCVPRNVMAARIRAFQQIGSAMNILVGR